MIDTKGPEEMYNFELVKELAKSKKIPLSELAQRIGYSEAGFHKAVQNGSMKIEAVIRIAKVLNISIDSIILNKEMLSLAKAMDSKKQEGLDVSNVETVIEYLRKQNDFCQDTIDFYRKEIEVKNRQIEQLMKSQDRKDDILMSLTNFIRGLGVAIDEKGRIDIG